MTSRALVLGGAGFIGRWVARELTRQRVDTWVAARDVPRAAEILRRWEADAEVVALDLATPGAAGALIERTTPATVFNLAGYGVDRGERDDAMARRINEEAVAELALACARVGAVLLHAGSALEYGTIRGSLREEGPAEPGTTYGRTKLAGTRALAEAARSHGTRGCTARLFTVFGDGEHEGRLFPSLLAAARETTPLDLTAGRQPRDFAFVQDVASALIELSRADFVPGEVVNLASGRLHPVAEFVAAVARAAGIPPERLRMGALPTRPEEMWHGEVVVERATRLLGAPLPGDLDAIVARAVDDARRRCGREPAQGPAAPEGPWREA